MERPTDWEPLVIDPVAQLAELIDLVSRGLLSHAEYHLLKGRVVGH